LLSSFARGLVVLAHFSASVQVLSIVENAGTFLLWYDKAAYAGLTAPARFVTFKSFHSLSACPVVPGNVRSNQRGEETEMRN
jgi:hypothetical protein